MKELSLHILDIVQNSIVSNAQVITISIDENEILDEIRIIINDNGKGMSAETLAHCTDPFFTSRTTRKVGLGLSLFKQNAELCSGSFQINSQIGIGTTVNVSFQKSNIDTPEIGDIAGVISLLTISNPQLQINYIHTVNNKKFEYFSQEIVQKFDNISLANSGAVEIINEYIRSNIEDLYND